MQAIFDRVDKIECVNDHATYTIIPYNFDECVDSISIITCVKETDLKRGWVGDLYYYTNKAYNIQSELVDYVECDKFSDVVLTHIKMRQDPNDALEWEYIFMKK